jgi:hypothetical protein
MTFHSNPDDDLTPYEKLTLTHYESQWQNACRLAEHHTELSPFDFYPIVLMVADIQRDTALRLWRRDPGALLNRAAATANTCLHFMADIADRTPPRNADLTRRWLAGLAAALMKSDAAQRLARAWRALGLFLADEPELGLVASNAARH